MRIRHSGVPEHFWRRLVAVVVAGVLAITILPSPPASAAGDSFVFEGGGWGHSVGMSQYGAFGMSQEGASFEDILTHYFTGASVATVGPGLAETPIWVNLTMESPSLTLAVRSIAAGSSGATFRIGSNAITVPPGQKATVTRLSNGGCHLDTPSGSINGDCSVDVEWDGWVDAPTTAIEIESCRLTNWNASGGSVSQPCTYARGTLHVRPDNNTNTVNSSIEIGLEDYVLGISEMPYGWATRGGMAALQAQAVAARSYVLARARWRGAPENRPWCWCQVYDTHYDQNYVGWGHGTQAWLDAVRSTEGLVLTHPSVTGNGELLPIETFYSSSTFGFTENSEDAFTQTVPYLRSVDDHWSRLPSVDNPHASWTKSFSPSQLASLLSGMSSVTGAEITRCSATGAALEITFHGTGGPRTFHTRYLRGALNIRSQQIVSITGPGTDTSCSSSTGTTTTTTVPTTTTIPTTTTVPTATTVATTTTTTIPTTTTTTTTTTVATTTTTTIPATTTIPTTTTVPTATTVATTTTTTIPTTTTVPRSTDSCPIADISIHHLLAAPRTLRLGSVGDDVREVQHLLTILAHYDGAIDGIHGQRTTAAVRSFQDARGLLVDGIVGSRTRGELAGLVSAAEHGRVLAADGRLLKRGVSGDVVRALQALLGAVGFDPGPVDGIYGSLTTNAVMAFQRSENLLIDGIVGIQSRAALTAALGLPTDCG